MVNKYINLITDDFVLTFLKNNVNQFGYYKDFFVDRNEDGIICTLKTGHDDKFTVLFTDFYIHSAKTSIKAQQKNWQIALTKKFGYEYLSDLREELSEVIRKEYIHRISDMQTQIKNIEERSFGNPQQENDELLEK